jgi:hypothetical protein
MPGSNSMAQVTFEALADWLISESESGENHDLTLLPIPADGVPSADDFFGQLMGILDLPAHGDIIDHDGSQWLVVRAFNSYFVHSYEYDVNESVRTMHEVHEFIDATEESAEEESQNLRDTYDSLRRDLDSGL